MEKKLSFLEKISAFLNLGTPTKNIFVEDMQLKLKLDEIESRQLNKSQIHDKLLVLNKLIKTDFKDSTINWNEAYQNSEKNLKVSLVLNDNEIKYIFKDFLNNELVSIVSHGKKLTMTINDIAVIDEKQINSVFEIININDVLSNIKKNIYQEKEIELLAKEKTILESVIKEQTKEIISPKIREDQTIIKEDKLANYINDSTIYLDIFNLTINKILKTEYLTKENDEFLNYNIDSEKRKMLLGKPIVLPVLDFKSEELNLSLESNVVFLNLIAPLPQKCPIVKFSFSPKSNDILKVNDNSFLDISMIGDSILLYSSKQVNFLLKQDVGSSNEKQVKLKNNESKEKILNFINAYPLLEETLVSLKEENLKLDQKLAAKRNELVNYYKVNQETVTNKINELRNKLAPNNNVNSIKINNDI